MSTNDNGGHEIPLTPPPAGAAGSGAGGPAASGGPGAAGGYSGPEATPASGAERPGTERSGAGRTIGVVLAVVGGVALLGSGTTAAFAAGSQLSRTDAVLTTDTAGVQSLDLEVGASAVVVRFADVDEAELRVEGGRGGAWTIDRDDDELIVRSPDLEFGWWFGGWWDDDQRVTLTLPESLAGSRLDADFSLDAGSLDVTGDFGDVEVYVGAGGMNLSGSAISVDAEISAGRAEIELADVSEADFTISAGRLVAELTGAAPHTVSVDVSAGSLDLTVPDDVYNVTQEVSAGSFDNRLETSSSAPRSIDATVSAGSATLRPGD